VLCGMRVTVNVCLINGCVSSSWRKVAFRRTQWLEGIKLDSQEPVPSRAYLDLSMWVHTKTTR
jgi:hypothetical protein